LIFGLSTAAILQAVLSPTALTSFRCIDAEQAKPGAVDFERVAIDYADLAEKIAGSH
jgi:hypothetical protein